MLKGLVVAVLVAAGLSCTAGAQAPAKPPAKKNPLLKLIEPWPAPEVMKKRREDAEALPLFNSSDPFIFTLAADFKALNKDRSSESATRFPGEVRIAGDGGSQVTIPVQ